MDASASARLASLTSRSACSSVSFGPRRHLKSCQTGADGIALALEVGVDALYDGAAHVKGEYDGARAHHGGLTAPVVGLPRAPPRFVVC